MTITAKYPVIKVESALLVQECLHFGEERLLKEKKTNKRAT